MSGSPEPRDESPVELEDLEELLSFVPPLLQHDPDLDVPAPKSSPVMFYDKHLDDSLILKRVKVLPHLVSTLTEALDDHVSSFKSRGKPFDSPYMTIRRDIYNKHVVATASDVSYRYCEGGHSFVQAASVLSFHPDQPELMAVFLMSGSLDEPPDFHSEKYSLKHAYKKGPSWPVMVNALDDGRRALLLSMRKSLLHMAVYEAFALSGKTVLEDMSGLSSFATFPWNRGGVSLYRESPSHQVAPPDASKYLWATKPAPSSAQAIDPTRFRRSERLKSLAPTTSSTFKSSDRSTRPARKAAVPTQTIITPKNPTNYKYQASAVDFVQRAWVQAVNFDSTIIVFDCGNYFRVGVRHRKTQTLYISDLVDASSTDPAYGKVITAINLAIIRDAMDRTPLLDPSLRKNKPSSHSASRKRPHGRDDTVPVRRSRRRLGEPNKEVEPEGVLSELSSRNVALLYFRHGKSNSPHPSFFRRAGSSSRKHSYRYNECLTLVLGRKLGQGAVGEAYEASLEVDFGDGIIAHYPDKVIVKLALSERQTERLRHEYSIYRHLSEGPTRVTNIPRAFGFFEDVESEAGALILSHAGVALAYRSNPPGTGVAVSAEERATYIEILTSIHEAGVAHGDIRSWNLLEDDKGGHFIADFDRAKLRGSRYQMAAEQERLGLLLDGENIDDFSVTSYPASS